MYNYFTEEGKTQNEMWNSL